MLVLKEMLQKLIYFLDGLSIFVIVWGTIIQFFYFMKTGLVTKDRTTLPQKLTEVKNILGAYILLGLEILIGADIIESIINPTIDHILTLAVIVIIRTVISIFLSKEISANESTSSNNSPSTN